MANYAIGDIQGCYTPFMRLLERIQFDESSDTLWFVGDLVNRGPDSLKVLRFIRSLKNKPKITLGNHDFHAIARLFGLSVWLNNDDTLEEVLKADDALEIAHWYRHQALLIHDKTKNIVMTHAGLYPLWDLKKAKSLAKELESALKGEHYMTFLKAMYGNEPNHWDEALEGNERLRFICNAFTRMRFCSPSGDLKLNYKGTIKDAPKDLIPWFQLKQRITIPQTLIFGHWAALEGKCNAKNIYAIDTGCLWGGTLTALKLEDFSRYQY